MKLKGLRKKDGGMVADERSTRDRKRKGTVNHTPQSGRDRGVVPVLAVPKKKGTMNSVKGVSTETM